MDKRSPVMFVLGLCATGLGPVGGVPPGNWSSSGHDWASTRGQSAEVLTVKSVFTTRGDVSAAPIGFGDAVCFPDWAVDLFDVNKRAGELIWSDYTGSAGSISRTSAAIHGDQVILGDIETRMLSREGASIIAVDRKTGALR